jgi:hypothetical protein
MGLIASKFSNKAMMVKVMPLEQEPQNEPPTLLMPFDDESTKEEEGHIKKIIGKYNDQ